MLAFAKDGNLLYALLIQCPDSFDIVGFSEHDQNVAFICPKACGRNQYKVFRHELLDGDDVNFVFGSQVQILEGLSDEISRRSDLDEFEVVESGIKSSMFGRESPLETRKAMSGSDVTPMDSPTVPNSETVAKKYARNDLCNPTT